MQLDIKDKSSVSKGLREFLETDAERADRIVEENEAQEQRNKRHKLKMQKKQKIK